MVLENYITNDYLRAFVVALILLVIARVFVSLLFGIAKRITKKTKSDIDDIVLSKSTTPLTIIIFLTVLRIPIAELNLSEFANDVTVKIIISFVIAMFGYLTYSLFDLTIFNAYKQFAKKSKMPIDDTLSSIISTILKVILIVLAALYILDLWGVQIGPLLAGLGIAGLAVALALQPTLSNIFSGIAMILDKSVKVGDLVYLDDKTRGNIMKIGLRSTKIKTFDNELIIIPNTKIADSQIQNIGLPEPKSRVVIPFSVTYGSDIEKVKKLIMKEIKTISGLSKEPEPVIRFAEMGSSSLDFKAYFYVDTYELRWAAIDEANTKIYNALNKAGISIPFPQLDVHLKKD